MRDAVLRLDNQREIVAAGISIRSEFAPINPRGAPERRTSLE